MAASPVMNAPVDLTGIFEKLCKGELTARALLEQCIERIGRDNEWINCFVGLRIDAARKEAIAADERISSGKPLGALDGIVMAVKDNIDLAGVTTAAGLQALRGCSTTADAEVVRRLRSAGAVIVGKTNMDEAAMGGTTANPFFGLTHNPHRAGYSAGGSSGGSAAAIASGMSVAALGTDTLGSTRIPASYCGIAAIKPTFGLISTRGVMPLCYRLDTVGLMAPMARDLVPLLAAVAGFDSECPDSRMAPEGTALWTSNIEVGVLAAFWEIEVEPHVQDIFGSAVAALRTLGRTVRAIPIGDYDPTRTRRAGLLLGEADASVTYRDILSKQPETLSPDVLALMTYGRDVAGEKIARASRLVDLSRHRLWTILREVEFIMTPTTPQSTIAHGAPVPANQGDFTALANIAGCPAVSIPVSLQDGRFVGIQLIGQPFAEERLLRIAEELQELLPHPPLPGTLA